MGAAYTSAMRNPLAIWLSAALLALPLSAAGQRILAVTTGQTVEGDPVCVHAHSLDFRRPEALPGPPRLPGGDLVGPVFTATDQTVLFTSTGPARFGGAARRRQTHTQYTALGVAPFAGAARQIPLPPLGVRSWIAASAPAPGGETWLFLAETGGGTNQLRRLTYPSGTERVWPLPGTPAAVAALPEGDAAVLCDATEGAVVTWLGDDESPRIVAIAEAGGEPVAMAYLPREDVVLALTSGLDEGGNAVSWLSLLRPDAEAPEGETLALAGAGNADSLQVAEEGAPCWVATRDRAAGHGYVKRLALDDGLRVVDERSFGAVDEVLRLAPSGDTAAVAVDARVLIWDGDPGTGWQFVEAVGALCWGDGGLFVGEGGRVHRVVPGTADVAGTRMLQTGHVRALVYVPDASLPANDLDGDGLGPAEDLAQRTQVESADTDGDGIHDGIDPEPLRPSPRLRVAPEAVFHGEAAGREVRILMVESDTEAVGAWSLEYNAEQMPWLKLFPRSSSEGGGVATPVQMAVDPAYHDAGTETRGVVRVRMEGTIPGVAAAGSPAEVVLRVLPGRGAPPRILWLMPAGDGPGLRHGQDPYQLGALADWLAAPPHGYSHGEARGPFDGSLDHYNLVVLSAESAARVAVSRRALLEYVADGGALVLLGGHVPDGPDTLPLLEALGFRVALGQAVQGATEGVAGKAPGEAWGGAYLRDGCLVEAREDYVAARMGRGAALAVRAYGYGRLAVLASAAPLRSGSFDQAFAEALFGWLERAGLDYNDYDGDGLVNRVENPNRNGTVEQGETDALRPDTDYDGIPDGREDENLNGLVDPGETDPRTVDSDGDGQWDGADSAPLVPVDPQNVSP